MANHRTYRGDDLDTKDLTGRYAPFTKRLVDSVLATPGDTPPELRRAVAARAARLSGGTSAWAGDAGAALAGVPAPLARYVDTVALHAYNVTDGDVAALLGAGRSDDALFDVTVAAALGAALGRLERGLAALRSSPPGPLSRRERGNEARTSSPLSATERGSGGED